LSGHGQNAARLSAPLGLLKIRDRSAEPKESDLSTPPAVRGRRRFVNLVLKGWVAAPLANAWLNGEATAADAVEESDPQAVALKYRKDATKSADRKDPGAVCDNCTLYTGKPGETTGTCELFGGRLVAAKGWCASWEGY
jgi:hypothetical protein